MRRDSAARLVFGAAAAAVGRSPGTQVAVEGGGRGGVGTALQRVASNIERACKKVGRPTPPRLVAVSKNHTAGEIKQAYDCGVRHFGENYVKDLHRKATVLQDLSDIRWHYVGRMQTNNISKLINIPGLWMVETLSSLRHAETLNKRWGDKTNDSLCVMLQVNTSGEENKQGCEPEACVDLSHYVMEECPNLILTGLMTIGRQSPTTTTHHHNPDFLKLVQCREMLCQQLKCVDMELSMGMTDDYEHAVELGSTSVRIGRAIFSPPE